MGTHFLFGTLLFTVGEDDDLEHLGHEPEEGRVAATDFEFSRGLRNSATTLQRPGISQLLQQVFDDSHIKDVKCGSSS
jgi:hypothetical protein